MIKTNKSLQDAKNYVTKLKGKEIEVLVNLGRNKIMNFSGTLSGVYPALFTIQPDDEDFLGKTAYSYSDVLCGTVSLKDYK